MKRCMVSSDDEREVPRKKKKSKQKGADVTADSAISPPGRPHCPPGLGRLHCSPGPGRPHGSPGPGRLHGSPRPGRPYTVSVALPGSIIDNAQSHELRTALAGQVARALVIFNVDEVVVFDEQTREGRGKYRGNSNLFLGKVLNYLETPQYQRKVLFPMHSDLKYVGMLSPLDCPHHMRQDEVSPYREGVVLETPESQTSSLVNCGLHKAVKVDRKLSAGVRVTVAIDDTIKTSVTGRVVPPSTPRTERGIYWGYRVRMADTFSAVFTEAPFEGGYDLTLGTSHRGQNIDELDSLPPFSHALVVLGGVQGLEYSLTYDHTLHVGDVSLLFHHYLNVCPHQGSRTIRTEEALLVVLSSLRPLLSSANK